MVAVREWIISESIPAYMRRFVVIAGWVHFFTVCLAVPPSSEQVPVTWWAWFWSSHVIGVRSIHVTHTLSASICRTMNWALLATGLTCRAGRLACHPSGRFQFDRYSKYHVSLMCVWGGEWLERHGFVICVGGAKARSLTIANQKGATLLLSLTSLIADGITKLVHRKTEIFGSKNIRVNL